MAGPAITLTANLQDFSGNPVGSTANPSKLQIALCGFGQTLPRISGTAMLAKVGPFDVQSVNGVISALLLYGTEVITPSGTYYSIAVLDEFSNIVQSGIYSFKGARQTIDLS